MSEAILSTYGYIRDIIGSKGDSLLPAEEDPLIYDKGHGAHVEVWSAGSQLLSWGFLEGAVVAMYNASYLRGKYRMLSFMMWDPRVGIAGLGNFSKGNTPMGTNTTATMKGDFASKVFVDPTEHDRRIKKSRNGEGLLDP